MFICCVHLGAAVGCIHKRSLNLYIFNFPLHEWWWHTTFHLNICFLNGGGASPENATLSSVVKINWIKCLFSVSSYVLRHSNSNRKKKGAFWKQYKQALTKWCLSRCLCNKVWMCGKIPFHAYRRTESCCCMLLAVSSFRISCANAFVLCGTAPKHFRQVVIIFYSALPHLKNRKWGTFFKNTNLCRTLHKESWPGVWVRVEGTGFEWFRMEKEKQFSVE